MILYLLWQSFNKWKHFERIFLMFWHDHSQSQEYLKTRMRSVQSDPVGPNIRLYMTDCCNTSPHWIRLNLVVICHQMEDLWQTCILRIILFIGSQVVNGGKFPTLCVVSIIWPMGRRGIDLAISGPTIWENFLLINATSLKQVVGNQYQYFLKLWKLTLDKN